MEPIEHSFGVKATPAAAYAAVATERGIKAWWARNCEVGESVGAPVELRFTKPGMSAVMNFNVSVLEPGQRVEWTCVRNTNPIWPGSKLSWEIGPAAGGSTVHFKHEGFSDGGPPYDMTVEGWQFYAGSLQAYLDGGTPQPSE
jgi:uncharacterized protein YndB with AHSA1/START domain